MRVLITAFGPFPGAPFNPTMAVVRALARRRRPALAGIEFTTHVFATTYAAVDRDLPKLFATKPDIVLMFGLAGRTRYLRIETRARNAISVIFPDASRYRPRHNIIVSGGPRSRQGPAPFAALLHAARANNCPARLSRDAGRYLCNYAYWRGLERAQNNGPLVQFIHIPPLRRATRPRSERKRPALTVQRVAGAAENVLIALIAATHR